MTTIITVAEETIVIPECKWGISELLRQSEKMLRVTGFELAQDLVTGSGHSICYTEFRPLEPIN